MSRATCCPLCFCCFPQTQSTSFISPSYSLNVLMIRNSLKREAQTSITVGGHFIIIAQMKNGPLWSMTRFIIDLYRNSVNWTTHCGKIIEGDCFKIHLHLWNQPQSVSVFTFDFSHKGPHDDISERDKVRKSCLILKLCPSPTSFFCPITRLHVWCSISFAKIWILHYWLFSYLVIPLPTFSH